jgi:hypothetical protein
MLKKNVWYPGHRTYKEGADPGFQIRGGGALKKIAPSGGRVWWMTALYAW